MTRANCGGDATQALHPRQPKNSPRDPMFVAHSQRFACRRSNLGCIGHIGPAGGQLAASQPRPVRAGDRRQRRGAERVGGRADRQAGRRRHPHARPSRCCRRRPRCALEPTALPTPAGEGGCIGPVRRPARAHQARLLRKRRPIGAKPPRRTAPGCATGATAGGRRPGCAGRRRILGGGRL